MGLWVLSYLRGIDAPLRKIIHFIIALSPMHLITVFSLMHKMFLFKCIDVFIVCLVLHYGLLLKKKNARFYSLVDFARWDLWNWVVEDQWLARCQKANTSFRILNISSAASLCWISKEESFQRPSLLLLFFSFVFHDGESEGARCCRDWRCRLWLCQC